MKITNRAVMVFVGVILMTLISAVARKTNPKPNTIRLPGLPGRLAFLLDFVRICSDFSPAVPNANIRIEPGTGAEIVVNGDAEVIRQMNITKIFMHIQNCEDATGARCQHFQTWKFDKGCLIMTQKNAFWSPMFNRIYPELRCPVAPDAYHLRNGTISMDLLRNLPFPFEKYFWKVQIIAYDPEPCFCANTGIHFLRVRS